MNDPAQQENARTAAIFEPDASPAVLNIVTYSFGSGPEATRADRIMRCPTAAILLQEQGALYEHCDSGRVIELPPYALLGPSTRGHVWSTRPDTRFTLVNLAPGATHSLFGVNPGEIRERIESLQGFACLASMQETLARDRESLHRYLCSIIRDQAKSRDPRLQRTRAVVNCMHNRQFGEQAGTYADQFGVSQRTLQRSVNAAVGLTPKQVLAIERIRKLVSITAGGWSRTVADLAQAGGYFDQSHMRYELLRYRFGDSSDLVGGDHVVAHS